MKKIAIAAFAALAFGAAANAQTNFQTFYDFNRHCFTTTLEGFHQDGGGNTFFFIDYDYQLKKENGSLNAPSGTYFEIARCLNFWQDSALGALSLHVEYNGGLGSGGNVDAGLGYFYGVNHAMLLGLDYFLHSQDFKNTLNLKVLFKKFKNLEQKAPLQFTAVWGCQDLFGLKGLRFSGFADVWWESKCVFLSEPQLWYDCGTKHFNIGGELELSANFAGYDGFACRPCIGTKWVF